MTTLAARSPLRIVPVIDLMGGCVVRGVMGQRERYLPLSSPLCPSSEPIDVAKRLISASGAGELYLADLDAILGAEPDFERYHALAQLGAELWVDAGIRTANQARQLADAIWTEQAEGVVVIGLETLIDLTLWEDCLESVGERRLVFSLDLRAGKPLTTVPRWRNGAPGDVAAAICSAGCQRMIVLDIADVGAGGGPSTLGLCQQLKERFPQLSLIAGGGVRGHDDLASLAAAGCEGALVSSWLHRTPPDRKLATREKS